MTVRAAYLTEPGKITFHEHELPTEIHSDGVLVEIIQANVCGSDTHIYSGNHASKKSGSLGHEMVGRIVMKGKNVKTDRAGTPIELGDRVVPVYYLTCHTCKYCLKGDYFLCENKTSHRGKMKDLPWFHGSTFATHYYIHPKQYFFKVPDGVTSPAASSANCALSQVIFGIDQLGLQKDAYVLIQGAGGLGINACAVASDRGAKPIVLDAVPSRLEQAKKFGAEKTINITDKSSEEIYKEILEITENTGVDYVIEVTGVADVLKDGIEWINKNGTYLTLGTLSHKTVEIEPGLIIRKSINILAFNNYNPVYLYEALQFLDRNKDLFHFDQLVSHTFKLDDLETAIEKSINKEVTRAGIVPG